MCDCKRDQNKITFKNMSKINFGALRIKSWAGGSLMLDAEYDAEYESTFV